MNRSQYSKLTYIDRQTQKRCIEPIYYESWIRFFYESPIGTSMGRLFARAPWLSALVGYLQRRPASSKKIAPFVARYGIDLSEADKSLEQFTSFDDFFTRTLKPAARPLSSHPLIAPADGRYLVYPNVQTADGFCVKGEKFSLAQFLGSTALANTYATGSLVLIRLCPTDYHRFHFPCDCTPTLPRLINGLLHSVNPIAIRKNIHLLASNKRMITSLNSAFGNILFCEIGATNIGSIHQTYTPSVAVKKGAEKGFFSFGASALLLLFEPGRITFCDDLISTHHIEVRCLMGQPLAK